jgi:hypothetical protein
MIESIALLYQINKTLHDLLQVLTGDDKADNLHQIGLMEIKGAIHSLNNNEQKEKNINQKIYSAIQNLLNAYESFMQAEERTFLKNFTSHLVDDPDIIGAKDLYYASLSAIIIAILYKYLGEDVLFNKYIQKAKKALSECYNRVEEIKPDPRRFSLKNKRWERLSKIKDNQELLESIYKSLVADVKYYQIANKINKVVKLWSVEK